MSKLSKAKEKCQSVLLSFNSALDPSVNLSKHVDDLDFIEIIMDVELSTGCSIAEGETSVKDFNTVDDLVTWLAKEIVNDILQLHKLLLD